MEAFWTLLMNLYSLYSQIYIVTSYYLWDSWERGVQVHMHWELTVNANVKRFLWQYPIDLAFFFFFFLGFSSSYASICSTPHKLVRVWGSFFFRLATSHLHMEILLPQLNVVACDILCVQAKLAYKKKTVVCQGSLWHMLMQWVCSVPRKHVWLRCLAFYVATQKMY